jgi:hypothetical protein
MTIEWCKESPMCIINLAVNPDVVIIDNDVQDQDGACIRRLFVTHRSSSNCISAPNSTSSHNGLNIGALLNLLVNFRNYFEIKILWENGSSKRWLIWGYVLFFRFHDDIWSVPGFHHNHSDSELRPSDTWLKCLWEARVEIANLLSSIDYVGLE